MGARLVNSVVLIRVGDQALLNCLADCGTATTTYTQSLALRPSTNYPTRPAYSASTGSRLEGLGREPRIANAKRYSKHATDAAVTPLHLQLQANPHNSTPLP